LLLRRRTVPDEERGKVQVIQRAADRMTEMIETLIDFTRIGVAGRLPISRVPIDFGTLAREVVDEARVAWPDRSIELDVLGKTSGQWDPARVAQAISNLVANALHHGDSRRPVQVRVEGQGPDVVLQVKNEGRPIPPALMSVLFEPFKRGNSGATSRGLGLGLYIVNQVVGAHDGTITVESSADAGTTFTLHFPRFAQRE
jgi:signal transduction histidine kinase